jgi:hypothetical protein
VTGSPVQFTAEATGGSNYEYRFDLWLNGTTKVASQNWSTANAWTLPADQAPGSYVVQVLVRTSSAVAYDAIANVPYQVRPRPAAVVTLASDPGSPSPHVTGTPVVFTAQASGVPTCEYRFDLWLNGTTKVASQSWSTANTWTMPADQAPGSYVLQVLVRTSSAVAYDAYANLRYDVSGL